MELGRRALRVEPPPSDDAGVPELVEAIRDEIEQRGPITFARFMQRALYEPGLGYYATSRERTTRSGDFLTAPELHPIFGRTLARQLDEMWQRLGKPADFIVREHGAGRRTLGAALPRHLGYQPIEFDDTPPPAPIVGCVLANELLDALPVHRVVRDGGALREIYVTWRGNRFVEELAELSSPALAEWFARTGIELAEGQRTEACLDLFDWLASGAAGLVRGYMLIIDYADEPTTLYGEGRVGGTLRAFRGHHVGTDVLTGVGRQDITATVDLAALDRAAQRAGLIKLGSTTQAEFLVGCGLEDVLADEREQASDDWQALRLLRSAVARLLDPRQLGGYRVVVYGRDVATQPPLRGLGYRLPRR